ncbi:hypothetical protein LBMAG27_18880 [Bacteroidota bacterium]|nr:hypothetical protein LBMAG27_18880 [Bacteroidota bacterium]
MALYVIDINERTDIGKALKTLLANSKTALKILSLDEYEKAEEKALMKAMDKSEKESLLSAGDTRKELLRMKKRISK